MSMLVSSLELSGSGPSNPGADGGAAGGPDVMPIVTSLLPSLLAPALTAVLVSTVTSSPPTLLGVSAGEESTALFLWSCILSM